MLGHTTTQTLTLSQYSVQWTITQFPEVATAIIHTVLIAIIHTDLLGVLPHILPHELPPQQPYQRRKK